MFNFNVKDFTLKDSIDFLLSFELMLILFLGSAFLLFLPEKIMRKIYLFNIKDEFSTLIGIIFFLSFIIILVKIILLSFKKIKSKYTQKKTSKNLEENLQELNKKEKEVIRKIFESENNAEILPLYSGITRKLSTQNIITKTSNTYRTDPFDPGFPYSLQPWAYSYLENNSNYFD